MPDMHIAYRTIVSKPRTGPAGKLFLLLSKYPVVSGTTCGLIVVAIAAMQAFDGVSNAPSTALALSAIVVMTWATLFYFMRTFFKQQTHYNVEVVRQILWENGIFKWIEGERTLKTLQNPNVSVVADSVPAPMLESEGKEDFPWPVWLVIESEDKSERLVIETKVTAREASQFAPATEELMIQSEEKLPVNIASPLLMLARQS